LKLDKIENIYLLGIGGIGMSALARYFKANGKVVSGYDKTPTPLTDSLKAEGINVHFEDNVALIDIKIKSSSLEKTLVIYTPAVPKDHSEYAYFLSNGFDIKKRSEVLGLITERMHTIAVAGTHGKTTTSTLIAHILKTAGIDCFAFLGGISKNYDTNLLLAENEQEATVVVEADEYDRSFLSLKPEKAVITSLDADHLDIYGNQQYMQDSYTLFASQIKKEGILIVKAGSEKILHPKVKYYTYSVNSPADYSVANIKVKNGEYVFDVISPIGNINSLQCGLPGLHNVENALAAVAIAQSMEISSSVIIDSLKTFKGVKRRFDYQIKTSDLVFIDDYAHHPEELKACINSVKQMYPDKKIIGVFQPHLYSRTRDFADGFAESLDLLDETILLDIYPARELPISGISSDMLLSKMKSAKKMICSKDELVNEIAGRNIEVLLTLGAGDIDMFVEPIKKELEKKKVKA
jgi:UDP-N-acetylmuramate--alanine ligase